MIFAAQRICWKGQRKLALLFVVGESATARGALYRGETSDEAQGHY